MKARLRARTTLDALAKHYTEQLRSAQDVSFPPSLLGVGRITAVEEEDEFSGTMDIQFDESAKMAEVMGWSQDTAQLTFETIPSTITDVLWTLAIDQGPMTLGRIQTCDITISEYSISAEHCRFARGDDGSVVIQDCQASNGVWVSGRRIPADALVPLDGNEQLVLGRFAFRFLLDQGVKQLIEDRFGITQASVSSSKPASGDNAATKNDRQAGWFSRIFRRKSSR